MHAITVDPRGTGAPIVIDDVLLDQRLSDESVAALAQVAVDVNARQPIAPHAVGADDRPDATVGHVDPMLFSAAAGHVVLDQQIVAVTAEDPPGAVTVAHVVANHD